MIYIHGAFCTLKDSTHTVPLYGKEQLGHSSKFRQKKQVWCLCEHDGEAQDEADISDSSIERKW